MQYVSLILAAMLAACVYDDPHQYFLRYQKSQIGGTIEDFNKYQQQNSMNKPIEEFILPNGNVLVKYWYIRPRKDGEFRFNDGQCMEIYEYDQISRKILKTSFEGDRCIWNP